MTGIQRDWAPYPTGDLAADPQLASTGAICMVMKDPMRAVVYKTLQRNILIAGELPADLVYNSSPSTPRAFPSDQGKAAVDSQA